MKRCNRMGGRLFSLLPAALLAIGVVSCGGGATSVNVPLSEMAPEAIRVNGELGKRLARNFDRMETPLYQPDQVFWSEEESGGWPGDKEGRTILALTLLQRATGRKALYLDSIMARLPKALNEKGYLGSVFEEADEQQLSGHGWLLRGLCEYYVMTGDSAVLDIAGGIVDGLFLPLKGKLETYPVEPSARIAGTGDMSGSLQDISGGWRLSSDIGCLFIGMEGLIHYYTLRPSPEVKELIESMLSLFMSLDLKAIKAQTHASLTALRGVMRYMDFTGDRRWLPEVESRWQLYCVDGMTENFENFNWFDRFDTWTEPCAIVDSFMLAVQLWKAIGNPAYLDMADAIYYNGLCHTQRANGGFGCDKPVGPAFEDISVHADEAHWCCTMRGGEGLAKVAQYSYFQKGDTILIPLLRDSELTLSGKDLHLTQRSGYPFGGDVTLSASGADADDYVVGIHIPAYMDAPSFSIAGELLSGVKEDGFLYVGARRLKEGELKIGYEVKMDTLDSGASCHKFMMGPLMMGREVDSIGLSPLYHLMDPKVSIGNGYSKKVLFHSNDD